MTFDDSDTAAAVDRAKGRLAIATELLDRPQPDGTPPEIARRCRFLRELGPSDSPLRLTAEDTAGEIRRTLHSAAADGDELATATLRLLADDPWWSDPEGDA